MVTVVPSSDASMPRAWTQPRVEWQSAPVEKFAMCVVPSASEAIMANLWEMDLSPGRESTPERRPAGLIICCMNSYCKWDMLQIVLPDPTPGSDAAPDPRTLPFSPHPARHRETCSP